MVMQVFKIIYSLGKKSLFSPATRRCASQQKMFHTSTMKAAKKSGPSLEALPKPPASRPPSKWRYYLLPTAVLGGIGGGLLYLHLNDEKRAIRIGQGTNVGYGSRNGPVIGGPFRLIDANGRIVTEKDLRGNWVLLHFGYTSSPDVGPSELLKLAKAICALDSPESQPNMKVQPVFVTVDPQRDTPSHLRAYLKEFDERIVGLTGPVGAVRDMAHAYRVFFKKVDEDGDDYLVQTSYNMYLMNPNLEIVRTFGLEYNAEQLAEEIQKELHRNKL
uniref:protein SCO1 homolog 2, mitochondrial isoform X2 n=1 Tax=Erigeron canadensis TaxID=72917 RepID=UPI001CB90672|nr:protein SCO1 homolog 2, mitochondrial isoform X2 [Erigeron canadensis]